LGDATGEVTRSMGATLASSVTHLSSETERLSSRVGAIAGALDQTATKLNSMQTPDHVFEVRLDPMMQALAQAADRIGAHSQSQAKSVTDALAISNTAAERSIDLVTAMRQDFDSSAAANRAVLEWAVTMIKSTAEVLNEIKTSSKAYTEGLTFVLGRTDETMRTFTEVLIKSSAEMADRTERLDAALPAIEARARTLALAAERIAGIVDDLRDPQKRPEWETID
jgi:hypothetical protein